MHMSMKCWLVFSFPQRTKASMYSSHYTKTVQKYFIMIFSLQGLFLSAYFSSDSAELLIVQSSLSPHDSLLFPVCSLGWCSSGDVALGVHSLPGTTTVLWGFLFLFPEPRWAWPLQTYDFLRIIQNSLIMNLLLLQKYLYVFL